MRQKIRDFRQWRERILQETATLYEEGAILEQYRDINKKHDQLQQAILAYLHEEIKRNYRLEDSTYCWVEMGSGGREERTGWGDQDHGLIYQCDRKDQSIVRKFLQEWSMQAVDLFEEIGYPKCDGRVMANNPRWLMTLGEWRQRWDDWSDELSLESINYMCISADLRPLYGDASLAYDLRSHIYESPKEHRWLRKMGNYIAQHPIPVGFFNQIFTESTGLYTGKFHLKKGGYYQLTGFVRLLALWYGCKEFSTEKRIEELYTQQILSSEAYRSWKAALIFYLTWRVKHHIKLWMQGETNHDYIALNKEGPDRRQLLTHLSFIKSQQKQLKRTVGR
jgi:CBS domain-containing protein